MKQRTKRTWAACLAVLWLVLPAMLQAQVHIGGTESAVKGALLDLTTPEGSNLGLLPLNVSIEDINEIPDAFTNKASITAGDLQGLIVYNTNVDLTNGAGLYVWDGAKWNKVGAAVPATGVSVSPTTLNFTSKTTSPLTATVEPITAVQTVTWDSNNTDVATVSADGVVTAVSNGNATITVTTESGKTATCAVTVSITGPDTENIGGNTYATYCYGATIGCWMVQNSKEGTASMTYSNVKYFAWSARNRACPAPWAVPTTAQWTLLKNYLNTNATAAEKAMWNSGAALRGYLYGSSPRDFGDYGEWWSASAANKFVMVSKGGGMSGPSDMVGSETYYCPVRCIKM
ncbi:MAG: Ig-like domain-containing protein [Candidatus Symbiothrix sp.]|nr:Ig-like domain-containing protein [Candidatus Symbiothrix sp.]